MKIRWSIVFLALFGVVAALGAAVLAGTMSASRIQAAIPDVKKEEKKVDVIVAARDLPARVTLSQDDVTTKTVLAKSLAESHGPGPYLSDPSQVVGEMLTAEVLEGEILTKDVFPSKSHGFKLARTLPAGKRAVTIALDDYAGLEGLLYPGSVVDVIASFKVESNRKVGKAVSTTLLQNIEVLGVEGNTIVDKSEDDSAKSRGSRAGMRSTLLITLLVDSRQAEALQLAMEHGSISLAMRNPEDIDVARSDATLLNDGNLAQLAALLAPKTTDGSESEVDAAEPAESGAEPLVVASADNGAASTTLEGGSAVKPNAPARKVNEAKRQVQTGPKLWTVDVRRGLESKPVEFPVKN